MTEQLMLLEDKRTKSNYGKQYIELEALNNYSDFNNFVLILVYTMVCILAGVFTGLYIYSHYF